MDFETISRSEADIFIKYNLILVILKDLLISLFLVFYFHDLNF